MQVSALLCVYVPHRVWIHDSRALPGFFPPPPHPPNLAPTQNRARFTAGLDTHVRTIRPREHRQTKMGLHADPYVHTEGRPLPSCPVHLAEETEADPTLYDGPTQGLKGQPGTGLRGPLRSPSPRGQQTPAATRPASSPWLASWCRPQLGRFGGGEGTQAGPREPKQRELGGKPTMPCSDTGGGWVSCPIQRPEEDSGQHGSQGPPGRGRGAGRAVVMAQTHPTLWPP